MNFALTNLVVRRSFRIGVASLLLPLLPLATSGAEHVRLSIQPRSIRVLPGEPVRVELTVQADSADPVRLHVPTDPLLLLRAVEKLPVQRTEEGVIVHRRVIIWQALEPGTVPMQAISVESRGRKLLFPAITITISDPGP